MSWGEGTYLVAPSLRARVAAMAPLALVAPRTSTVQPSFGSLSRSTRVLSAIQLDIAGFAIAAIASGVSAAVVRSGRSKTYARGTFTRSAHAPVLSATK